MSRVQKIAQEHYFYTENIRNQENFIFNTDKAYGQVNGTCLQKKPLHIKDSRFKKVYCQKI